MSDPRASNTILFQLSESNPVSQLCFNMEVGHVTSDDYQPVLIEARSCFVLCASTPVRQEETKLSKVMCSLYYRIRPWMERR